MLYPSADLVLSAAAALAGFRGIPTFKSPVITDADTAAAIARFHRSVERKDGALAEASRLVELLAMLARRHASESAGDRHPTGDEIIARRVDEYLQANFNHNVTLAELSTHVGVSAFHLARRFRAARGIPPHRYLEQLRVRKARSLILLGESLSRASSIAGFYDQAQLTRHFRRHYGVTPGQYRAAVFPPRHSVRSAGETAKTIRA